MGNGIMLLSLFSALLIYLFNGNVHALILFSLLTLGILVLTIYAGTYHFRKDLLFKLFKIIRKKSAQNQKTDEEAASVIKILYANNTEVISPIYIFVNEGLEIDLLVIALLRAALRYFNTKIEIEMHGQGYLKMDGKYKKRLEIALRKIRFFEKNIAYTGLPTIKKLDLLILECIGATRIHCLLLKANGEKIPKFKPLFYLVQKTKKDPRRLLFPTAYE